MPSLRATEPDRYPGALSFADTPLDRLRFFGRTADTETLLHQFLSVNLLTFFGKSGVGKTSLLRAALFPLLRNRDFLPVPIRFNESGTPLQIVTKAVAEASRYEHIDYTAGSNGSLWEYFKTAIFWRGDRVQTPVLILDQFEEIFTLHQEEFRRLLATELGQLVASRPPEHLRRSPASMLALRATTGDSLFGYGPEMSANRPNRFASMERPPELKILIGVREDYLGALQGLAAAIPEILLNRFRLTGLPLDSARGAITKPATLISEEMKFSSQPFAYEDVTLEQMIGAARDVEEGCVEPFVLQLLCSHIEKQVRDRQAAGVQVKVDSSYLGGGKGIPAITADFYFDALRQLPRMGSRRRARAMCEEGLLTGEGRRRRMLLQDLRARFKLSQDVFDTLENGRLLTKEPHHGSFYYEISHDRVAQAIYANRKRRIPRKVKVAVALIVLLTLSAAVAYSYHQYLQAKISQIQVEEEIRRAEEAIRSREKAEQVLDYVIEAEDRLISRGRRNRVEDIQKKIAQYYEEMANVGESDQTRRKRSVFLNNQGDLFLNRNNLNSALISYQESLKIREELAAPTESDLLVCYTKIGDIYQKKGDLASALNFYRMGLGISEKLALRDPANRDWQNDLSAGYKKVGDLQRIQGDLTAASASFQKALEIDEKIPDRDRTDDEWQSLLASYDRIGDMEMARDRSSALSCYQKGLRIAESLVARNRENTEWRSALAIADQKIGDVQADQGDSNSALNSYQTALPINESLALRDPDNTVWQRNLSANCKRIGDLKVRDDLPVALNFYRKALQIGEKLVAREPANKEGITDLVRTLSKVAWVLERQGTAQKQEAELAYRRALNFLQPLADGNRLTSEQNVLLLQIKAGLDRLSK